MFTNDVGTLMHLFTFLTHLSTSYLRILLKVTKYKKKTFQVLPDQSSSNVIVNCIVIKMLIIIELK